MKFRIVLEFDPGADSFSAFCPELPGCASAGDTEEEARRNIEAAIKLYLEPSELNLPDDSGSLRSRLGVPAGEHPEQLHHRVVVAVDDALL